MTAPAGIPPDGKDDAPSTSPTASPIKTKTRHGRTRPSGWRSLANPSTWRRLVGKPWFEAVLTVVVIVILLGSLLLYSGSWPPLVVIESSSMQHGSNDVLGIINAGDLVLVKEVNVPQGITTYVEGEVSGYQTYGEYGDVILYEPNGVNGTTPVIHRAILWLEYNASQNAFNAPTLLPLSCGKASEYYLEPNVLGPTCVDSPNQALTGTIILNHMGWNNVTVSIDLNFLLSHSAWTGFITLGDNNSGTYDQTGCVISCIVRASWVQGVARGMIPWLGGIKLWLSGNDGYVPKQSWDYLGVTIAAVLILPQALPWSIHRWRERRTAQAESRAEPSTQADDLEDNASEGGPRRGGPET